MSNLDSHSPVKKIVTSKSFGPDNKAIKFHELVVGYQSWLNYKLVIFSDIEDVLSDEEFRDLDAEKIRAELNADLLIINGPKYWLFSEVQNFQSTDSRMLLGHKWSIPGSIELKNLENSVCRRNI